MACSSEGSRRRKPRSLSTGERSRVSLSGVVAAGLERRRDARAAADAPSARMEAMAKEGCSGILRPDGGACREVLEKWL